MFHVEHMGIGRAIKRGLECMFHVERPKVPRHA